MKKSKAREAAETAAREAGAAAHRAEEMVRALLRPSVLGVREFRAGAYTAHVGALRRAHGGVMALSERTSTGDYTSVHDVDGWIDETMRFTADQAREPYQALRSLAQAIRAHVLEVRNDNGGLRA